MRRLFYEKTKQFREGNVVSVAFAAKNEAPAPLIDDRPIGYGALDIMINVQQHREYNPQMKSFADYLIDISNEVSSPIPQLKEVMDHNALRLEYFKDAVLSDQSYIHKNSLDAKSLLDALQNAFIFAVEYAMDLVEDLEDGIIDETAIELFADYEIPDEIEGRVISYIAEKLEMKNEGNSAKEYYGLVDNAFAMYDSTRLFAASLGMDLKDLRDKICK